MSNSVIDNQIDLNFIFETTPPTERERDQAWGEIMEFNSYFDLFTVRIREEVTEENINTRVLNMRRRLNRILTYSFER